MEVACYNITKEIRAKRNKFSNKKFVHIVAQLNHDRTRILMNKIIEGKIIMNLSTINVVVN